MDSGNVHWRPQSVLLWIPFDIPLRNHRNGMTRGTTSGTAVWSAKPGLPTGVHRAFSYGFRDRRSLASTEHSLMDSGNAHWRPQSVLLWIPFEITGIFTHIPRMFRAPLLANRIYGDVRAVVKCICFSKKWRRSRARRTRKLEKGNHGKVQLKSKSNARKSMSE